MKISFNETDEFKKDFKRLSKKYKSLPDDLLEFKKVVAKIPLGISKHFMPLHIQGTITIVKARLFCRYLKGSSLRLIYAYNEDKQLIEFIELYFKGDKENEDRERIKKYFQKSRQQKSKLGNKKMRGNYLWGYKENEEREDKEFRRQNR